MERYETLFAQLKNRQEGAFVPFVTLGDPGPEQSLKIPGAVLRNAGGDPPQASDNPNRPFDVREPGVQPGH